MTNRFANVVRAAMIALLWAAIPAFAAEPSSVAESPRAFTLPSGAIPTQIFSNDCVKREGDANLTPILLCQPAKVTEKPSISVSVTESKCEASQTQMKEKWSRFLDDGTPFFNIVWEQAFAPLSVPQAVGFRGFYQMSLGNRYVWAVCGDGKLTTVLVQMFSPTNNEALKAEVESKVFGVTRPQAAALKESSQ